MHSYKSFIQKILDGPGYPSDVARMPVVISDSEVKVNAFLPFQIRYSIKRPEVPVALDIGLYGPFPPH